MTQNIITLEHGGLRMHVFTGKPVIFEVASVVLEGDREVALIDAQFSKNNAHKLVEFIKSTGKKLSTVFISYSDPDYYFGLDHIASHFPKAKIYATPQTVYLIDATKDEKMGIWAPQLGANAPKKIIVPTAIYKDHFSLEGRRIEIKQAQGDEQHSFLWIPSARTILGGVYLNDAQHLWIADSPAKEEREKWLAGLDAMKQLKPEYSIPAHFIASKVKFRKSAPIDFTRNYLTTLESALSAAAGSSEVIARMKALYHDLGGESNLEMSAKVLKSEMAWKTAHAFPAICRKAEVDFGGEFRFELDFHNEHTMTFRGLVERKEGMMTDTVNYTAVEVAPEVYMVYWTEKDNSRVVHVEDFGYSVAHTNISSPDGSFIHKKGSLKLLP